MDSKSTNPARSAALSLSTLCSLFLILGIFSHAQAEETGLMTMENEAVADYLIGPGDVLGIAVWKEEELQRTVTVRPDGKISFPLIGELETANRTPTALQREITERLTRYIPDPVVTVIIEEVSSYQIYVIGEVNNSGQYQVSHYIDVVQALALAGGLTPFASENSIKILRRENGTEVAIPFQYARVKGGRNLDQNIILRRGDVVIVP